MQKSQGFLFLESVIGFCIVQLETDVASHPEKEVFSIVWELKSYSEEEKRTWFWELKGKRVICRHVHIAMNSADLCPPCIWLPTFGNRWWAWLAIKHQSHENEWSCTQPNYQAMEKTTLRSVFKHTQAISVQMMTKDKPNSGIKQQMKQSNNKHDQGIKRSF